MFITKKINKTTVAVLDNYPVSIAIRCSGKEYYGKEEVVCEIVDDKLVIYEAVAAKYGLAIEKRQS